VRLGLLLSSVGEANNVTVGQEELNRAMATQAQQFPGQEQEVFKFYRENPQAAMQLQAPLFEDKVVDYVLELAHINERKVPKDELLADPHAAEEEAKKKPAKKAKPASKPAKKKAAAGKSKAAGKPKAKKKAAKKD